MKKKSMKKIAVVGLVTLLGSAMAACGDSESSNSSGSDAKTKEKIVIGYISVANDAMIAQVEGLYDEMNVEYELVEFSSGKDVNNALASGSIDVGYIGTVPCASGIATDMEYEVFWIDGVITQCEGLATKEGINTLEDLEGTSIGVVTGSTSHYSLIKAIESVGLSEDDVEIINGSPAELVAMWERGDIEGAYTWQPSLGSILDADGTMIFSSEDAEEIGAMTATIHVVRKKYADEHPDAVKELVDTFVKAQKAYEADPDKVIADVADALEMEEDMCKTTIEGYRWISKEDQASENYLGGKFAESLKDTADFLESQGSITTAPELSDFENSITNEFVK